jgi:hypothetical protein
MRIGERARSTRRNFATAKRASAALERKRKGRGRQKLSVRGKKPPRLPPLDL